MTQSLFSFCFHKQIVEKFQQWITFWKPFPCLNNVGIQKKKKISRFFSYTKFTHVLLATVMLLRFLNYVFPNFTTLYLMGHYNIHMVSKHPYRFLCLRPSHSPRQKKCSALWKFRVLIQHDMNQKNSLLLTAWDAVLNDHTHRCRIRLWDCILCVRTTLF